MNGLLATGQYPAVGLLYRFDIGSICTGTLIGCDTFLTAAHCIAGSYDPAGSVVFFQHYGFVGVTSGVIHPDFINATRSDVAILHLDSAVTGVAPFLINTVAEPANGTTVNLAGFGSIGMPGNNVAGAGILRAGNAVTSSCFGIRSDEVFTCLYFDESLGAAGTDSNTCVGDSGGPMFANIAGLGIAVTGVTSGGVPGDCQPDSLHYHSDVVFDQDFIVGEADGDLAPRQCSSLPAVSHPDVQVAVGAGTMLSTTPGVMYDIPVPSGLSELRIMLNGEIQPTQDYDLYVSIGDPPTPEDLESLECFSTNTDTSLETCVLSSPSPGDYKVLVDNSAGSSGQFQMTATLFGARSCPPLDADGDGSVEPETDGVLLLGYLFGFRGPALTGGALDSGATRDADEIAGFLGSCSDLLDIDDNGKLEPLADGMLFLRYLFDFRGDALISGAVGANCGQCLSGDIEDHIESLLPP